MLDFNIRIAWQEVAFVYGDADLHIDMSLLEKTIKPKVRNHHIRNIMINLFFKEQQTKLRYLLQLKRHERKRGRIFEIFNFGASSIGQ